MSNNKIDVFICNECKHEDSSYIPFKYSNVESVECPECHNIVANNIVKMIDEPFMTLREYFDLLNYIVNNHGFGTGTGKMIKYVSHTLDTRTGLIYKVKLDDEEFTKVNENKHRNLKTWIMEYLE